jgi:hypothetical protein
MSISVGGVVDTRRARLTREEVGLSATIATDDHIVPWSEQVSSLSNFSGGQLSNPHEKGSTATWSR